ncbi:hypothetical protein [Nocardioides pakistanensis]
MRLTPEERAAVEARATAERDQWLTELRENPAFVRGGFPLSSDPAGGRAMHVDVGNGKPRCTECNSGIFGDEEWLPNECALTEDQRHVYPNGEKCPPSPGQLQRAEIIDKWINGEPL